MKKTYLMLVIAVLALINGCMHNVDGPTPPPNNVPSTPIEPPVTTPEPPTTQEGSSSVYGVLNKEALVDKNKYLVGGKEFAETAKVHFQQNVGKGYEIKVNSGDKTVSVEVMTDKECINLDNEEAYTLIGEKKEGMNVVITNNTPAEEKTNICVHIIAVDEGEITAHITVTEMNFS